MRACVFLPLALAMFLPVLLGGPGGFPAMAGAETIAFSGTVTYDGAYAGDSLYVAVIDKSGGGDGAFLALGSFAVGPPPFSQPYSFDFDNAQAGGDLFVAAILDVDGGGLETVGGGDVVGWYAGQEMPLAISPAASRVGIDFALPLAEIHGTVTFDPRQVEAWVDVTPNQLCTSDGFRPLHYMYAPGTYAILGVYPGTYCVRAGGYGGTMATTMVCYGDPGCLAPALVTVAAAQVVTDVDLDFAAATPLQATTWGAMKGLYR